MNQNPTLPDSNVCLFASEQNADSSSLFTYQFVYETLPTIHPFPEVLEHYRCHLVVEGSGTLETDDLRHPLGVGDLFFVKLGCRYSLTDIRGLKYIYISFAGLDPDKFLSCYGITDPARVFPGYGMLIDQWIMALSACDEENLTTLTKGLLYYALALLPSPAHEDQKEPDDVISRIRAFIDRSYGNGSLSLDYVCRLYNYHPNYISRKFREATGYSFSEYLENCRIRHAKQLLHETDLPISVIASGVGYHNAMYFSKVFRKCAGSSPSEYRKRAGQG